MTSRRTVSTVREPWSACQRALCSLSIGRIAIPCARAAAVTSSPAQTIVSLFASASSFPASNAARVGRIAAWPDVATMTRSASGSAAIVANPSGPTTIRSAGNSIASRSSESSIATISGLKRRICSFKSAIRPPRAARPTIENRSGWASTTSSACVPIEPVHPRRAIRIGAVLACSSAVSLIARYPYFLADALRRTLPHPDSPGAPAHPLIALS